MFSNGKRGRHDNLGIVFVLCLCLEETSGFEERLTTVCLISSVLTVVLFITCPAHGDAATAGTSEEVDRTFESLFICKANY